MHTHTHTHIINKLKKINTKKKQRMFHCQSQTLKLIKNTNTYKNVSRGKKKSSLKKKDLCTLLVRENGGKKINIGKKDKLLQTQRNVAHEEDCRSMTLKNIKNTNQYQELSRKHKKSKLKKKDLCALLEHVHDDAMLNIESEEGAMRVGGRARARRKSNLRRNLPRAASSFILDSSFSRSSRSSKQHASPQEYNLRQRMTLDEKTILDRKFRREIADKWGGPDAPNTIPKEWMVIRRLDRQKRAYQISNNKGTIRVVKFVKEPFIDIEYEIVMQNIFARHKLSPKVYAYRTMAGGYCAIFMDKVDVMLEGYFQEKRTIEEIRLIVTGIEHIIDKMCEFNIAHLDAHWGNWGLTWKIAGKKLKPVITIFDTGYARQQISPNHSSSLGPVEHAQLRKDNCDRFGPLEYAQLLRTLSPIFTGAKGMEANTRKLLHEEMTKAYKRYMLKHPKSNPLRIDNMGMRHDMRKLSDLRLKRDAKEDFISEYIPKLNKLHDASIV